MPAQPGTEVVQRTPQQELVAQIRSDEFKQQIALALPENVTVERFTRVAITALQANPAVAELERQSVARSLLQSAAMGLMPDGREAAIVPYKGKAQLIPMIAGFRKIAADYGWTIYTAIAYENDLFEYEQGLDVRFRHVPVRPGQDRGEPIAAYAVGKHFDGRRELEVLTVEEVEKIRSVSQTGRKEDAPWTQWWHQMAEKSAGRRLFKKLPLAEDDKRVRIVRAAALEPSEAAEQMYGPTIHHALGTVNRETGEITPGAGGSDSEDVGGRPAASPDTQQAGAAALSPEAGATPADAAPAPEPEEDPEPVAEADDALSEAWNVVVPAGGYEGETLAAIADRGALGEQWFVWASRNPSHENVGPSVHAALQKIRPQLFSADS